LEIDGGDIVTFETGEVAYESLPKCETVEAISLENFNAVTGPCGAWRCSLRQSKDRHFGCDCAACLVGIASRFGGHWKANKSHLCEATLLLSGQAYIVDKLSATICAMIGCIGLGSAEGKNFYLHACLPV
jgi:hypothetical protein